METTLSELPFFPVEEATLSQLPFFPEDSLLPPRPSSVCSACWEGPFAGHLGVPLVSPVTGELYQPGPREITYSTSVAGMRLRADAGCVWCQFVLGQAVDHHHPDEELTITLCGCDIKRYTDEIWIRLAQGMVSKFYHNFPLWHDDVPKSLYSFQWITVKINGKHHINGAYVYTGLDITDNPAKPYFVTPSPMFDLEAHPLSSLELMRDRIKDCTQGSQHGKCHSFGSPAGPMLLPKRLVDCTNLTQPWLFSPTGKHAEYLALSYVWGGDQVHKTTKSNLSTYEHRIAPSLLPATIRDAIRLTKLLGFRALWVDSLCIVQDSDEDKAHEIGRMHHIYRHAHLTIVAASAERASEGFLHQRPLPEHVITLPFICPPCPPISQIGDLANDADAQSRVGQVYLYWIPWGTGRREYRTMIGRMATRSWCMQEYLLSPRSLIFTRRAVLFRCCTALQTVGSLPESIKPDLQLPKDLFLAVPPVVETGSERWQLIHTVWKNIVNNYSERTADVESDKLVACAAIAELFHGVLRSDYLAGFWRSDVLLTVTSLLWHRKGTGVCTRPTAYRAPSWSWASVDGPIWHYYSAPVRDGWLGDPLYVAFAEVAECWVTREDEAFRFGRVTDGALVLRGTPIPCRVGQRARWHWSRMGVIALPSFEEARNQQWGLGSHLHSDEEEEEEDEEFDMIQGRTRKIVGISLDCDADELPGRLWLVPFMRDRRSHANDEDLIVSGIVLQLAPPPKDSGSEREMTRFRRIGILYAEFSAAEELEHSLWGPLIRAAKNGELPWTDMVVV
ncbi:hypothetical protein VTO73DRAFT_5177 [Trametes versicolor]